ncbi:MAG: DtxR family transcriptional regulator [Deltaproteobacteria bacterium]|nr:DtxR family transcriptional regulator [Deltaproteobacteria bacterium]
MVTDRSNTQHEEEVLEALWIADEDGEPTFESVRNICTEEITEADIDGLVASGMVERSGDRLVLTGRGYESARKIVRRHRLAATLMYTVLGVDAEKREAIACEVEHTLVPEMTDGICTLLGHPHESPDGKSIPPGPCCKTHRNVVPSLVISLAELQVGASAKVIYIQPKSHERMHRLTSFGITPGTIVELHQKQPAYSIHYEGTELALDKDVAEDIFVVPIGEHSTLTGDRPMKGRGAARRKRRGWFRRRS